ncbi:MAG: transglutaminase-like domain-containing protein, partial [Candidatus Hydrogenedentota bacterium]
VVDGAVPKTIAPQETWMAIYPTATAGPDERIGTVHTKTAPGERDGVAGAEFTLAVNLATTMMSTPAQIDITGTTWNPSTGGIASFDFDIKSFDHEMNISGRNAGGRVDLNVTTAGETIPLSLPVGKDFLVSGNLGTTVFNLPALEIGDEVVIDAFDPMTLSMGKAHVKCIDAVPWNVAGEEVFTKLLTTTIAGVTTKVWVTMDEEVVRIETPFGFTLEKIRPQDAYAAIKPSEHTELIDVVAIRPTGLPPVRGAKRMRIRISGLPDGVVPPNDTIQRQIDPGVFEIRAQDLPSSASVPSPSPEWMDTLTGDAFVQTGHPKIRAQVDQIVSGSDDALARALKIHHWVYGNIDKIAVLTLPSALEVLESREGDCNEHTVLCTALARTAGVPTRIAIGVVYSEELGGFYYHAWPEVHLGRWIGIDPTLGQESADATHIKLVVGGIDQWTKLVGFMGQLQIEVLEIE